MIVAIDTNILVKAFNDSEPDHQSIVGVVGRRFKICHDFEGMIRGEYDRNLGGTKAYRKWYIRLQQVQAIHFCTGKFPEKHRAKLTNLSCHQSSDHAFIGAAFNSDRILVSEDSDVGKGPRGSVKPHYDALAYLTGDMKMRVYDAAEFCQKLWPNSSTG